MEMPLVLCHVIFPIEVVNSYPPTAAAWTINRTCPLVELEYGFSYGVGGRRIEYLCGNSPDRDNGIEVVDYVKKVTLVLCVAEGKKLARKASAR